MKNLLPFFLWCYVGLFSIGVEAQLSNRWRLEEDGSINWSPQNKETHQDHIEMSGKTVSVVFRYGVENGKFVLNKSMVWPQLRVIPNDTYGSLMRRYNWNLLDMVTVNGRAFTEEQVLTVNLKVF